MNGQLPLPKEDGLIETRSGLIRRLGNWDDSRTWNQFFETYWRFIYRCALKAGLTEDEAQEVVQETVLTVAKKAQGNHYHYDRKTAKFKTFLWRIVHFQILRRERMRGARDRRFVELGAGSEEDSAETSFEQIPGQTSEHEQEWEAEWIQNLVDAAAERVKRMKPKDYQVFEYRVVQQRSALETARALAISVPQVYVLVHRVKKRLRQEVERERLREWRLSTDGP